MNDKLTFFGIVCIMIIFFFSMVVSQYNHNTKRLTNIVNASGQCAYYALLSEMCYQTGVIGNDIKDVNGSILRNHNTLDICNQFIAIGKSDNINNNMSSTVFNEVHTKCIKKYLDIK